MNTHGWIRGETTVTPEGWAKAFSGKGSRKKNSASYVESDCQLKEDVGLTSGYERSLETCESCSIVVQGTEIGLEKI